MSARADSIPGAFATTHWSVVLAAGCSGNPDASRALEHLCQAYWRPVYAFIRRATVNPEDARDLAQGFFTAFLERRAVSRADPSKGRFRSYLLGALKHFLADEHARAQALKRGGGREIISLEALADEETWGQEPVDQATPERVYERRWALSLMERALARLQEECGFTGKATVFSVLRGFLTEGTSAMSYPDAARELGMTEATARMTVTRLRRRYGELVRAEVAETLGSHDELDDEMRHLRMLLSDGD